MEVVDKEYASKALPSLYKTWKEQLYCDVTLKCESRSIKAHKIVLAAMSDYFNNIFKYSIIQHEQNKVKDEFELDINIFKEDFFEQIVEFAYTGKMKIDGEYVQELAVAASFLQIKFIQFECEKFMSSKIDIDNVMQLVSFSNRINLLHLFDSTCVFISNNFSSLHKNGAFWSLEPDEFKVLLTNANFTVFDHGIPVQNPELEILKLVGMYLSVSSASKKDFEESVVPELIRTIHFEEILDVDDIKSAMDIFPILDCEEIQDVINLAPEIPEYNNIKRKYSNSCKKLRAGKCFANGGQENHVMEKFDKYWKSGRDLNDRPIKFRLFIRRWDGRPIIGGISVEYTSGKIVQHGGRPNKESIFVSEHEFSLEDNEVITKVIVRSGFMIDNLRFFTNFGREFGPFGGPGGSERVEPFSNEMGYVHSLDGKVVMAQQFLGITCLRFNWVIYGDDEACNEQMVTDEQDNHKQYCFDSFESQSEESDGSDW